MGNLVNLGKRGFVPDLTIGNEKFGIDELKKLIGFVGDIEDDVFKIVADSKVNAMEVIGFFFQNVKGAIDLAKHAKDIKNQFLDLSEVEVLELAPNIEAAFEIEEGKARDAIEDYVVPFWSLIESTFEHLEKIKKRKQA